MNQLRAIHDAVVAGDMTALRAAFGDDPAFPNVRDECGDPPLDAAIYAGPVALVRALIELGADVNYEATDGFPSLIAAIDRQAPGRHEILELLLDAGADVQQRGLNDYTPLHHAVSRDDAVAVTMLLDRGADPAARTRIDNYGTSLEEAEQFGHEIGAAALRNWLTAHARDAS